MPLSETFKRIPPFRPSYGRKRIWNVNIPLKRHSKGSNCPPGSHVTPLAWSIAITIDIGNCPLQPSFPTNSPINPDHIGCGQLLLTHQQSASNDQQPLHSPPWWPPTVGHCTSIFRFPAKRKVLVGSTHYGGFSIAFTIDLSFEAQKKVSFKINRRGRQVEPSKLPSEGGEENYSLEFLLRGVFTFRLLFRP